MDSVFAFVGKDYVLMACDAAQARSIVLMKGDQDKIMKLDQHKLMGLSGEIGDAVQFSEYVQKNMNLYALSTGIVLDTHGAAHYTRNTLATALRKHPYQVNLLLGGYDAGQGPSLYYIDYLGSCHSMPTGAQGYCAYFISSIMDRKWRPDMSFEDGLDLLRKCIKELNTRFTINYPGFFVKVVTADGVRVLSDAEWKTAPAAAAEPAVAAMQ
jgi:20S proteasome subunit beta 4